ncbi:hypothetical protein E2C01_003937 [Portunus trituberculatus]|uniref:Uncharacterized protein n=1 Tax=Portunus trituberculatus TaxID=210409 RepID=A0A5B7CPZ9_PORTR|nr:hypothetical protein [Portunus trituberculatus]
MKTWKGATSEAWCKLWRQVKEHAMVTRWSASQRGSWEAAAGSEVVTVAFCAAPPPMVRYGCSVI